MTTVTGDLKNDLVKVNVRALLGNSLDWAVAKAINAENCWMHDHKIGYINSPSTDWAKGGPLINIMHGTNAGLIIEKLGTADFSFKAVMKTDQDDEQQFQYGSTVLIAAMRCFVASKLGTEVEVPVELL